jgi:hypothetical protein
MGASEEALFGGFFLAVCGLEGLEVGGWIARTGEGVCMA